MKISYAITVCNELEEVKRLLDLLLANKREQDEIVVLLDDSNCTKQMEVLLHSYRNANRICLYVSYFENHFADWKNKLTSYCKGDYVFQIDADEYPHTNFIADLPTILEVNPDVDLYLVPRVNTVEGLTPEHIQKWGWHVNQDGWVNWPDWQHRIYRNSPEITWQNKVHEILAGHKKFAYLPQDEEYALFHPKTIERQEKQNNYYNTL